MAVTTPAKRFSDFPYIRVKKFHPDGVRKFSYRDAVSQRCLEAAYAALGCFFEHVKGFESQVIPLTDLYLPSWPSYNGVTLIPDTSEIVKMPQLGYGLVFRDKEDEKGVSELVLVKACSYAELGILGELTYEGLMDNGT